MNERHVPRSSQYEGAIWNCRIKVTRPGLPSLKLTGQFKNTCDAVAEALERFPDAVRVSVIAMKDEA